MDLSTVRWRKSSFSGDTGGQCLEVAGTSAGPVAIRDSKNVNGPTLTVGPYEWNIFLKSIRPSL